MKKIAIFGGSFNPPTIAHEQVIEQLANKFHEVWIIPSYIHRQKENLIDLDQRLEMLNITLRNIGKDNIKLKNIEPENNFQGKAYLLMDFIKKENPKFEFYYVIGKDIINNIRNWFNYEEFIAENNFFIVPRKGIKTNNQNLTMFFDEGKNNIIATTFQAPELSSSQVRDVISFEYTSPDDYLFHFKQLEGLLSENVLSYIESNNLYRK